MRLYKGLIGILLCSALGPMALADSELDSEINDLQVHLMKVDAKPTAKKKQKLAKRISPVAAPVWHSTEVADNSISVLPPGPPPAPADAPRALDKRSKLLAAPRAETSMPEPETVRALQPVQTQNQSRNDSGTLTTQIPSEHHPFLGGLIQRITLLPMASVSTFDGDDGSKAVPTGVNSPVAVNPAGSVLIDFNLGLGSKFMIETGYNFFKSGAETGDATYPGYTYFTYNDKVTLTYMGIPISAKYLFSGEQRSSFFVKAGTNPLYLYNHAYETHSGYDRQFRFGSYSQWDILMTAGIGYDLKLGKHFQVVVDISGYQGLIPVFGTLNAYNVGGTAGLGFSYLL